MRVLITGGSGMLGQRLARVLLTDPALGVRAVALADLEPPALAHPAVTTYHLDVREAEAVRDLVSTGFEAIFHLAAVMSAGAEADFDLGMAVNVQGTLHLLEAARHDAPGCRFVLTSSLAAYGGLLPEIIDDRTALTPQSSYGTQKAVAELLLNDYSRKGFIDGLALRLPTVSVRPGRPNSAASSFASDIIREPLLGRYTVCPVDPGLALWLTSPASAVNNLCHALRCDTGSLGHRSLNVPGITVTVAEMLETLGQVAGPETRARVSLRRDPATERIVGSWPSRFDCSSALELGFSPSETFRQSVESFRREATSGAADAP